MDVVDLRVGHGPGAVWGAATDDLNVTLLAWPPGGGPGAYANPARDVLLVVVEGSGVLELDGRREPLEPARAVVIEKGARFRVVAGVDGMRYLTAHRRRGGLEIGRAT